MNRYLILTCSLPFLAACSTLIDKNVQMPAQTNTPASSHSTKGHDAKSSADTNQVQVIKNLIKELGAKDAKVRKTAAQQLQAAGETAIPHLQAAEKHKDPEVREAARAIIASIRPPEPEDNYKVYIAEEGDDLYLVAMMWGVSLRRLKAVNKLETTNLWPGQRLKIPILE